MTKQIHVGKVPVGGGAPVSIQSMTNTRTDDVQATLKQIRTLAAAGCDIIRVAVPDMAAARAVAKIKEESPLPVVVDIHFDYKLALEAIAAGADKVRINPGNIGGEDRVKAVADACRQRGIPIRIGINTGSLPEDILAQSGGHPTAEGMVEGALRHIRILERMDYRNMVISLKASDVPLMIEAYERLADKVPYALHLGVTEAGLVREGSIKSAIGIGTLLHEGIGDTIRVSLTGDPVEEIKAGQTILSFDRPHQGRRHGLCRQRPGRSAGSRLRHCRRPGEGHRLFPRPGPAHGAGRPARVQPGGRNRKNHCKGVLTHVSIEIV